MLRFIITGGLASVLLAGCAVAPSPVADLGHPTATTFRSLPQEVSANPVEARWWTQFGDPELDRLIEKAQASNLDVRLAMARVHEARALARAARAGFLPTGGVGAAYVSEGGGDEEADRAEVGSQLGWELDLFGRVRAQVAAAESGVSAALLRGVRASVSAEVAKAYFEFRGAQNELTVARRSLENQTRTLETTRRMKASGATTALDVARAEAQTHAAEARIPELERRIDAARNAMAVLLGEDPVAFVAPGPVDRRGGSEFRTIAIGSPAELLKRRSDVEAAQRGFFAATQRSRAARAELFPSVRIVGSVTLEADSFGALDATPGLWGIGPRLTWPLFDLPRLRAMVDARDAQTESAIAAYHKAVLTALRETEDALANYDATTRRMRGLQAQRDASRRAAELAAQRFQLGDGDYLDVLDADRTWQSSEAEFARSSTEHLISVVEIYRALGAGWDAS